MSRRRGNLDSRITDVFASIERDMRAGQSREEIIAKLEDGGLAPENAEQAYQFVSNQRRKKLQTRLVAFVVIVVLALTLYFFAPSFIR